MLGSEFAELLAAMLNVAGFIALPLAGILFAHSRNLALRDSSAAHVLEQVIDNLGEGFYRTSLGGKLLSANPALVAINGCDTEDELVANVRDIAGEWYVNPDRLSEFKKILSEKGNVRNFVSEVYRHKTRERIWISENARLVCDPKTGKPSHYEGTVNETTDIMVRIQEEERLRKLASHVPGGLFQLVRTSKGVFDVVFASSGFTDLLDLHSNSSGFDIEHFVSLIHPEDLSGYNMSLKISRQSGRIWSHDFRVVTDHGKTKWLKVQATPESKPDYSIIWHGYLQDISTTKADEAVIRSLAYHDTLTKLPNRRSLIDRIQQKIASCQRSQDYSALLFIDVDNFKQLNDLHGHEVGDLLLIEIGKRLGQMVRRNDTVARLAGDEFVVLLDMSGANKEVAVKRAKSIARKITASFQSAFVLGHLSHIASVSIGGLAFTGDDNSTVDDILRMADIAMYDVKKSGRNAFKIYEHGPEGECEINAGILTGLDGLACRGELELQLQPQLDRIGFICGAEALIRWNHPQLGLLKPEQFMALAEKNGQINTINSWVLERAMNVLQGWQRHDALAGLRLAINIGLQQFMSDGFVDDIELLAKRYGVDTKLLTLEVTEKIVSQNRDNNIVMMEKLRSTGVSLSLDDFGVDYSSFSLLNEMPLNEIKIDGKFIKSIQNRPKDKILVKSILVMAEALGLSSVAEHVETPEQEKLLMELGCAVFQGFLYGGAMSQADFEMAVAHNNVAQYSESPILKVA
jgi:diguanylate cyclase (GGDEF)-like protein